MVPRLLKSALVGLLAAFCGLILAVVGMVAVAMVGIQGIAVTGAGGLGAISFGISDASVILVTLACFAIGSRWMYRRLKRRAAR